MPFKDGTGPLGQGSGTGKGQRKAGRNQLQQCGTGWGRRQTTDNQAQAINQWGAGRRFNLTNQDEPVRPLSGAGRRGNCRFRLMSNNPNM